MEKVKIVFVGTGNMGQMAHLRNYAVLPDCEVVAVVELREKLGQAVAQRYGIAHTFTTLEDFKKSNIPFDGFVAVHRYRNNVNIMPELYAFGKPVLSEKPIALSVEVGTDLARLAAEKGVAHVVGYHKRSDPAMEFGLALADKWKCSGKFGKFRYLRATMPAGDWIANGFEGKVGNDEAYPDIVYEPEVSCFKEQEYNKYYDTFVNYYIHQINAVRMLLGEEYHITYAEKTKTVIAAESASGIPAVIEMSPWQNTLDWQEAYLLAFDKGWIKIELPAPMVLNLPGKVTVYEDNGEHSAPLCWSPTLPHIHAMKNQAINYIKFIRGDAPAKCTAEEAVKDLELARDYVRQVRQLYHLD